MEYRISIIDREEGGDLVVTSEKVAARSVQLAHRGGDRIDTSVVGSTLSWVFVGLDCRDGKYQQLFTGDENRFEVILEDEDDVIIWRGFLLPDAYKEPYRNYVQDVAFQASDGLGRLKGKFLEEYPSEISVVDAISRILGLTGVELDLQFAPGINNSVESDYKKIYIPTTGWGDKSAYNILDELALSLASCVYQVEGVWRFVGWNFRMRPAFSVRVYDHQGFFQSTSTVIKDLKRGQSLAGGNIYMQPPYGVVEVNYLRTPVELPEGLSNPGEQDWVDFGAAESEKFADGWEANSDFPIYTDGEVVFFRVVEDGEVSLERNPYLQAGQKYKFTMSFTVEVDLVDGEEPDDFNYTSPFNYTVFVGGQRISSNKFSNASTVGFFFSDGRRTFEIEEEFVVAEDGFLDIVLEGQSYYNTEGIDRFIIQDVSLEALGVEHDQSIRRVLNENHTTVKELSLPYGDDPSGVSPAFRLERLDQPSGQNSYSDNSVRFFQYEGRWHYMVSLELADLVSRNMNAVSDVMGPVDVESVEFNWMGGQEHAIISEDFFFHSIGGQPVIFVQFPRYDSSSTDRESWTTWRDAAYGIEYSGFVDTLANVIERIASAPLEVSEVVLQANIKFDDILMLPYQGDKRWALTQTIWDIDRGDTSVVATNISSLGIFPPVVVIEASAHSYDGVATLSASAVALEGQVDRIEWEVLAGSGTISSPTGTNTTLTLTGSWATVQATVYDTFGRSGTATRRVFRFAETVVTLERTSGPGSWEYEVKLTPEIPEDFVVNLIGLYDVYIVGEPEYDISILVDGQVVAAESSEDNEGLGQRYGIHRTFSFAYIAGAKIEIIADIDRVDVTNIIRVGLSVDEAYFKVGEGSLSGLPASTEIEFI